MADKYMAPTLDDKIKVQHRQEFVADEWVVFDPKSFASNKSIAIISSNFQNAVSAAIGRAQDQAGKEGLENMREVAAKKQQDVRKMLIEAQNKAAQAGMDMLVRFDPNRSEMEVAFVPTGPKGRGFKKTQAPTVGKDTFKVLLDVGSAKTGYTNGVPARKSPSLHFTAKDPNNIGAYFTTYTEDTLSAIINVLDKNIKAQKQGSKNIDYKQYYKEWAEAMDNVVLSVIGTTGHASTFQKEAFKDEYNYGSDSRRRANFLGTNVKMAGFLRELSANLKKTLNIERDDISDDQLQKDLMMYITIYQKKHLGKKIAENFLKNRGYQMNSKQTQTLVGEQLEAWLGKTLLRLNNTIGFGSENALSSQTMSFAGGDEYMGYANSPDDTRALQQYQNSRKRYKARFDKGNNSNYKRGRQRHFANKDDDMSIVNSAEELTYKIALLRRDRFFEAYERAKETAAIAIRNSLLKGKNYEALSDSEKQKIDSKTKSILEKQGYFDIAPELREDMGYATASAMKEWTSSSTRTTRIEADEFKKWEDLARQKLEEKHKKGAKTFKFGRNTYTWSEEDQLQFIKDYIAFKSLKNVDANDIIGHANINSSRNESDDIVYDVTAEAFMGKEFLDNKKIGREIKTITRGGLRGYDERMADSTLKNILRHYFYRETLEQGILSGLGDSDRFAKYEEFKNKNLSDIEAEYRKKMGFGDNKDWEKEKKKIWDSVLSKAKSIDKVREHEGIKLQQSWAMLTGIIENEYDSLEKGERKAFLDELKKINYFKRILKSTNGTDIVKFSNIPVGSSEDNFDIYEIYKGLRDAKFGKGKNKKSLISGQNARNLDDVMMGYASMVYRDAVAVGDVYDWNNNVAYGPKERAGLERTIAASGSGSIYAEALKKRVFGGEGILRKNAEEAMEEIKEIDKIINTKNGLNVGSANMSSVAISEMAKKSYHEGQRNYGVDTITIGRGSDYSLSIDDLSPQKLKYVRGHVSKEDFDKTVWGQLELIKDQIVEAQNLKSEEEKLAYRKKIKIAVAPGTDYAFGHEYSKQGEVMARGSLVYLPNVNPVSSIDSISGERVYSLPGYGKEVGALLGAIRNDVEPGKEDEYKNIISERVKDLSVELYDEAHTNKGAISERAYKVRAGMSKSFQTSPISVEQILNRQSRGEDVGKYIHGAFASESAIRTMLRDMTDYKDENGTVSDDAKQRYLNDLFVDLQADNEGNPKFSSLNSFLKEVGVKDGDFANAQRALIDALVINSYTNGLRVLSNRFPSIEQEPVRNIRLYADKSIKSDKIIKLGAGLAAAQKDDYDGDMHNIKAKMLGEIEAYRQDKTEAYDAAIIDDVFDMTFKGPDSDYEERNGKWVLKSSAKTIESEFGSKNLKFAKELAEVTSRLNKLQVGNNSNKATAMRNFFDQQKGFSQRNLRDENGNINIGNLEGVARANILTSAMQTLEQDAISSKKIRDRIKTIIKEKTKDVNRKLTAEEKQDVADQLLREYDELNEMIAKGSLNGKEVTDADIIKRMTQMGILGKEGTKSLASRVSVAQIKKWAKDAYGSDQNAINSFYKNVFGDNYKQTLKSGAITEDQYLSVLKTLLSDKNLKRDGRNFFVKAPGQYGKASIIKASENRTGMDSGAYHMNKHYITVDKRGRIKVKAPSGVITPTSGTVVAGGAPSQNYYIEGESVTSAISRALGGDNFPDLTGFYEEVAKTGDFGGKKLSNIYGNKEFREYSNIAYATKMGDVVHAAKEAYIDFVEAFGKNTDITQEDMKDLSSMKAYLEKNKDKDEKAKAMLDAWNKRAGKDHTQKAGVFGALTDFDAFIKATSLSEEQYHNRIKNVQSNAFSLGERIAAASLEKIKGNDKNFIINEGSVAGSYQGHLIGGQYDTVLGVAGANAGDPFQLITQDIKTRSNTDLRAKDLIQPLIYAYYQKQAHEYLQRADVQEAMRGKSFEEQWKMFEDADENAAWKVKGKKMDEKMFNALFNNKNIDFLANVQYANRKTGEYATYRADLETILKDERGKSIFSNIIGKGGVLTEEDKLYLQNLGIKNTSAIETGKIANYAGQVGYEVELDTMREINKLLDEKAKTLERIEALKEKAVTASPEERKSLERIIELENQHAANLEDEIENKKAILSDEDKKALEVQRRMGGSAGNGSGSKSNEPQLSSLGRLITQSFSLYRIIAKVRQLVQKTIKTVEALDKAMTNIRIVSGLNKSDAEALMHSYNELAQKLGTTTQAVAESANAWLRQGYSIKETEKLIESSTHLSKLGMLDMQSATKVLTSALKGFKLEASQAETVVDKLTKLDTKFAASAGEIGEALSRTAAVAKQANMTLDETAAAVTVVMDVTQQSAEMAGTAIRTMLSRYGNVKAGSFVNMDEDDAENLNDIEKVLKQIGIQVRGSNGDMRSYNNVLDDLNEKWVSLTTVEKNAVATAMAGTRQRNSFLVLMDNYDKYQDAIKTSETAAGTAEEKYKAYTESIEYSLQKLTAAWEKFYKSITDSDTFKWFVDFGTWIINVLFPSIYTWGNRILTLFLSTKAKGIFKGIGSWFHKNITGGSIFGAAGDHIRSKFDKNKSNVESDAEKEKTSEVEQQLDAEKNQTVEDKEQENSEKNQTVEDKKQENSEKNQTVEDKKQENSEKNQTGSKAGYNTKNSIMGVAVTSLTSGITAGAMGNNNTFDNVFGTSEKNKVSSLEATPGDRWTSGLASGTGTLLGGLLGTALSSLLGPFGPILGTLLGGFIGDAVGSLIKFESHREELERKDRVDHALELLKGINGIKEPLEKLNNIVQEGFDGLGNGDSDLYVQLIELRKAINDLFGGESGELFTKIKENLGFDGTIQDLFNKILSSSQDELEKINSIIQSTVILYELEQTYKSQEIERLKTEKNILNLEKKYKVTNEADLKDILIEQSKVSDKAASDLAKFESYLEERNSRIAESDTNTIKAAYNSSGVSGMSASEIANSTLEEITQKIVDEAVKSGALQSAARDANGNINASMKGYVNQVLKDSGKFGSLFNRNDTELYKLLRTVAGKSTNYEAQLKQAEQGKLSSDEAKELYKIKEAEEELGRFASALGISVDDLRQYSNILRDVKLEDLSKNISELTESMDGLNSIVSDVVKNGGLSIKNLFNIITKYPQLLAQYNDNGTIAGLNSSSSNIYNNILRMLSGDSKYSVLLGNALYNQVVESESYLDLFKETLKGKGKDAGYLEGFSNIGSAITQIRAQGHADILSEFLSGIEPSEYLEVYSSVLDQVSSYQKHMIDQQIDRLKSEKDAIGSVNEEYKKQIDLIKAREALENAKNEKKLVYRAGVGFTYEADRDKIREAEENLKAKEEDKEKENFQYQIDTLEKMSSIIENMPKERELQESQKFFEMFNDQLGNSSTEISTFIGAIQTAYKKLDTLGENIDWNAILDNKAANSGILTSAINGGAGTPSLEERAKNFNTWGAAAENYESASITDVDDQGVNKRKQYNAGIEGIQALGNDFKMSEWKANGVINDDGSFNTEQFKKTYTPGYNPPPEEIAALETGYKLWEANKNKSTKDALSDDVHVEKYVGKGEGITGYTNKDYNIEYYNGLDVTYYGKNDGLIKGENGKGELILVGYYWNDKEKLGDKQKTEVNDFFAQELKSVHTPSKKTIVRYGQNYYVYDGYNSWNKIDFDNFGGLTAKQFSPTMEKDKEQYFQFMRQSAPRRANASGTLDFSGGSTFINELGTEGIITPSGTLTALPSHTGIVPADLTRNLYELGELAPTMIKRLGGYDSVTLDGKLGNNTDNSMNVQNLYATFETDEGFDFNRLLIEARQYVATTKNNMR